MTRHGLWHSTLAGGVANIWGYLVPAADEGGSQPYPNREQIRTYAKFFEHRFQRGMERANDLTDGLALAWRNAGGARFVFYKEDADAIRLDLSGMQGDAPAIAVDTKIAYKEVDLGRLRPREQTWKPPYVSDWAIAVEER